MENKVTKTSSVNISIESETIKQCPTNKVEQLMAYLYTLCGFEKMPSETQDMVLISFIRNNFSDITLDEIKLAFELGISGETGVNMKHYHNFNAIYFSDVINAYKAYQRGQKDIKLELTEPATMTPKQERDTTISWLNNHVFPRIEKFFKTGEYDLPDYGNTLYNYLEKKFINFTKERKLKIKEQARLELLKEYRIEKIAKPSQRNEIAKIITDILTGDKKTDAEVKVRGRNIALKIFLIKCKEADRDLITEIKEYENL